MSAVQQFHEALTSLKFSDLRHFEELENALTTRKTHLTHLKQQHIGDLGADVFKNPDISHIIFKFKRESNRLDQVERNKRDVVHELNCLFEFNPPVQWCHGGKMRDLLDGWRGRRGWRKRIPKSIDFYQYNEYDYENDIDATELPDDCVFEVVVSDFCDTLFSNAFYPHVCVGSRGDVRSWGKIKSFCLLSEKWKNPIYTGKLHRAPLNNFTQWVLKEWAQEPNIIIGDMRYYKKIYNFYNTQYDKRCPWFEFIQNNMRLEKFTENSHSDNEDEPENIDDKPKYDGKAPKTPLSNFTQWVLQEKGLEFNSRVARKDMDEYIHEYVYDPTKYDEDVPWFEFIQNNMRLE